MQSGIPSGVMCRAVQELCRCLSPLLEKGDLLDVSMWDVAEKNPVTPLVPTERASSLEQKPGPLEVEPTALPAPNIQEALEPEGAACPGELAFVWRRLPPKPPGFTGSRVDESGPSPLEEADLPVSISMGAWPDLSSFGSMQVIVSHSPMMGEVQYQYQSMVISQMSLQLALPKSLDHPNSHQQLKGP